MNTTPIDPQKNAPATLLGRLKRWLRGHDRGTVAVTFILCLPLLLFVISLVTQYALIVNARIVLDHAAAAAARSAITALPTDSNIDTVYTVNGPEPLRGEDYVTRAALIQLAAISPASTTGVTDEAQAITTALHAAGVGASASFASRYGFAAGATSISWQRLDATGQPINEAQWQPVDFAKAGPQRIQLSVQYNFFLNAPGVKVWGPILTGQKVPMTISGITGYFLPMTAKLTVQLTSGREAAADTNGLPLTAQEP
jgi:Flp pilus assembly protein TadG